MFTRHPYRAACAVFGVTILAFCTSSMIGQFNDGPWGSLPAWLGAGTWFTFLGGCLVLLALGAYRAIGALLRRRTSTGSPTGERHVMRRSALAGITGTAVLASTGAIGVAAADNASVQETPTRVVRHLQDRNPVNTDLDLGKPGFSVGDGQVFTSQVFENGRRVATSAGTSQIVGATLQGGEPKTITVSLAQTLTFADGTLAMTGAFTEDVTVGPRPFTLAVTGGTGDYRTSHGEYRVEFIRGTDNYRGTLTLITGR